MPSTYVLRIGVIMTVTRNLKHDTIFVEDVVNVLLFALPPATYPPVAISNQSIKYTLQTFTPFALITIEVVGKR